MTLASVSRVMSYPQQRLQTHLDDVLILLLFVPLTVLFLVEWVFSLNWRMVHDTPLLHYVAFLIDHFHYVPYKDIFETSMPGTFLFHLAIGKLFGYGDLAFRLIDSVWLAALLLVTWGIMRRFGRRVAWGSVILFGLSYLQYGPSMSLQRDYLAILPISAAVYLAMSRICRVRPKNWESTGGNGGYPPESPLVCPDFQKSGTHPICLNFYLKGLFFGILFGLAATIKPHLAIGLPVLLFFAWQQENRSKENRPRARYSTALWLGVCSFIGMAIPVLGVLTWLWQQGALAYFWEMIWSYLPLHLSLTHTHETISGLARLEYLAESYRTLGGRSLWLIPAGLGGLVAGFEANLVANRKREVFLLGSLAILYSLYPVIAGQFFLYHWMPFQYFIVLFAALALVRLPDPNNSWPKRIYPIFVLGLALFLVLSFSPDFLRQLKGFPPSPPKGGRVDEIANYLSTRLTPGDTVQPLDWTGGAVHAMLLARAEVATSFIYDYHFYHHISNPYIQTLRQRFLQEFTQAQPRFVVEIQTQKPWVSGPDTTREFRELRNILASNYSIAFKGKGYVIYERR